MFLIADSGSSKTDWRIWSPQGGILQAKTGSLNPYFTEKQEFLSELSSLPVGEKVEKIFFYSAGCSGESQQQKVGHWLKEKFEAEHIEVHGDMLGAARGVAGKQEAVVCILGTGSNACLYDGERIVLQTASNGVWFGDEGGGAYLGKCLIRDVLEGVLPAHIQRLFEHRFGLDRVQILESIYSQPKPAQFLASFVPFVLAHIEEPYFIHLVSSSFEEFLKKRVLPLEPKSGIHFVGGVAFRLSNLLRRTAGSLGLSLGRIIEKPIAGLSHYHFEHLGLSY
jgi:N-acetylglucosamine kinase-like BadF-type ATPase